MKTKKMPPVGAGGGIAVRAGTAAVVYNTNSTPAPNICQPPTANERVDPQAVDIRARIAKAARQVGPAHLAARIDAARPQLQGDTLLLEPASGYDLAWLRRWAGSATRPLETARRLAGWGGAVELVGGADG